MIGDLLLVNREEILPSVIQRHSHRERRLVRRSKTYEEAFFHCQFFRISAFQFFSFYSNSLLLDQLSPSLALGKWQTKESHSPVWVLHRVFLVFHGCSPSIQENPMQLSCVTTF